MRRYWWAPALLFAALILVARYFAHLDSAARPPSERWSRAVTIGEASSPIPPAGALLGEDRYLWAWSAQGGLAYAVVSDRGEVVARGFHPGPSPALNVHVLARGPEGARILWLDPADDALGELTVNAAGEPGAARVLATGVDYFTAVGDDLLALARDGEVTLLDPSGEHLGRVDVGGEVRSLDGLVVDGRLLLAVNRRLGTRYELLYLSAHLTSPSDAQVVVLESGHVSLSTVIRPARLGVVDGEAYVLSARESAGGEARGRGSVEYYVFPLSRPAAAEHYRLTIYPGKFRALSEYVGDVAVTGQRGDSLELLVAAHVRESIRKRYLDILELSLRGGEVLSLHRVSQSAEASLRPAVLEVPAGEVAAWLETAGFGKYAVRMAGTTPALRAAQNALRPEDLLGALGDVLLSVLAVLPLGLVAGIWLVPCYAIILSVTAVATTWAERNGRLLLGAAVFLHLVIRTSVVYRNLYVPAVMVLMPGWMVSPPGYYGLPLAAAIGGLCAYLGSAKDHASAIDWVYRAYTIFALVDAALLLLTFGPYILH